jgi:hypothetical protein
MKSFAALTGSANPEAHDYAAGLREDWEPVECGGCAPPVWVPRKRSAYTPSADQVDAAVSIIRPFIVPVLLSGITDPDTKALARAESALRDIVTTSLIAAERARVAEIARAGDRDVCRRELTELED